MTFTSFLLLTGVAAVVALIYHYGLRMRFLEGGAAFLGKLILGWVGAWVGTPIFGNWGWKYENVYIVPAILGAIAAIHLNVLGWKALTKVVLGQPAEAEEVRVKKAAA